MDNLVLNDMLKEAYDMPFLDSIEFLKESERSYKKSDFYKKTKIKLKVLYKEYFVYRQSKYDIWEKVDTALTSIDPEVVSEKLGEAIELLDKNEKVKGILSKILNNFDIKEIVKQGETLKKEMKNLK